MPCSFVVEAIYNYVATNPYCTESATQAAFHGVIKPEDVAAAFAYTARVGYVARIETPSVDSNSIFGPGAPPEACYVPVSATFCN